MSLAKTVRRANVTYTLESFQSGIPHVPLTVSNGVVGGWFDHHGFMSRPNTGIPEGRTVFGYIDQYYAGNHGLHIQIPLAVIQARFADGTPLNMVDCTEYRQELDIYDGVLVTSYNLYGSTRVTAFASQHAPNLFIMKIDRPACPHTKELVVSIECDTSACQNKDRHWNAPPVACSFEPCGGGMRISSHTGTTSAGWTIHCPGAEITRDVSRLALRLPAGSHEIRILVHRDDCPGLSLLETPFDNHLQEHCRLWHGHWKRSWADLPDPRAHRIWSRMKYYLLSNFPSIPVRPMCPTGLAGNIWGFTFPQDVYYVAENLPRLGHFDRSRIALEFWLKHIDDVKTYGKRLLGTEGAYYPWTPPFKDFDKYETDGVVGADSYELHNPAYVAAMVWHHYLVSNDNRFLKRFFPVIEEVFRFYAAISEKTAAGTYDTYHEHARGQDESSTAEGKLRNLLCVSYSAEYTARSYLKAAAVVGTFDTTLYNRAADIASSGYTRAPLLSEQGMYSTYEGDTRPLGSQKHPVQLNSIAYLPMPDMVDSDPAITCAWRNRYSLTIDARKPLTLGWTIGEFALASVRMRNPDEFEKDLRAIQPCRGADPRWIQFYESSFWEGWHLNKSYYFPMMGLYLQAFTDCIIQEWRGYVDLFACLPSSWIGKRFAFHGIHTRGCVEVSGRWNNGKFSVTLKPHGAKNVGVRVSINRTKAVVAQGHKDGPCEFESGKTVTFEFNGRKAMTLKG